MSFVFISMTIKCFSKTWGSEKNFIQFLWTSFNQILLHKFSPKRHLYVGRSLSEGTTKGHAIKSRYAWLYNSFAYILCFGSEFDKTKLKPFGRAWNSHILFKKFKVICIFRILQGPGNPGLLKSECMFNYHLGKVSYISIKNLASIIESGWAKYFNYKYLVRNKWGKILIFLNWSNRLRLTDTSVAQLYRWLSHDCGVFKSVVFQMALNAFLARKVP